MKIAFLTNVFDEWELTQRALESLRGFYPDAALIVCSDSGENLEFRQVCEGLRANFLTGFHLKRLDNGAAWVVRQLIAFSQYSDFDLFIKFDPDSLFLRPFETFPDGDLFGNVRRNFRSTYVQGGCLGMRREALQKLLKCNLFANPAYSTTTFGYQRYLPPYLQSGENPSSDWFVAGDIVLSHVARILKLSFTEWSECLCFTSTEDLKRELTGVSLEDLKKRYAVLHPCKTLELDGILPVL